MVRTVRILVVAREPTEPNVLVLYNPHNPAHLTLMFFECNPETVQLITASFSCHPSGHLHGLICGSGCDATMVAWVDTIR